MAIFNSYFDITRGYPPKSEVPAIGKMPPPPSDAPWCLASWSLTWNSQRTETPRPDHGDEFTSMHHSTDRCPIFRRTHTIPSGKLTVCYWKWPFIVDFPINSMMIFHSYVTVYQRVLIYKFTARPLGCLTKAAVRHFETPKVRFMMKVRVYWG